MKVVFDTNVLVSALVFPGGRGEEALLRIVTERHELILSKPILDELLGVLRANSPGMPRSLPEWRSFLPT